MSNNTFIINKCIFVRISEALRSSIEDIYNSIVNHPFMKGLADGSLDIEKFRFYIVQDRMYLGRFIRRWL